MSLFSCEKIFINGNLDGMWRLESVEKGNEVINPESIFYSFQRHLVMMGVYSETKHPENYYMGCFVYENDSIVMDNFYRYPGMSGDCVPKELENLYIYDIVAKFYLQMRFVYSISKGVYRSGCRVSVYYRRLEYV